MNTKNSPFERYMRVAMLESAIKVEASLIRMSLYKQLAGKSDAEALVIRDAHELELDEHYKWADYLLRELSNRLSDGLPPKSRVRPDGECLPRSRAHWVSTFNAELGADESDPLLGILVDFCVKFMVASSIGAAIDTGTRTRLLDHIKKRLKPLTAEEGFPGNLGDSVVTTLSPKPTKKN